MMKPKGKQLEEILIPGTTKPGRITDEEYFHYVNKHGGVKRIRIIVRKTLDRQMDFVRPCQIRDNPTLPDDKYIFPVTFLEDLDEKFDIESIEAPNGDKKYELRFYSSTDTILDYAGGFDCWFEVYDLAQKKPVVTIKIDITGNPQKTFPGHLADAVFYVDFKHLDPSIPGGISPNFLKSNDYKSLLRIAYRIVKSRLQLKEVFEEASCC